MRRAVVLKGTASAQVPSRDRKWLQRQAMLTALGPRGVAHSHIEGGVLRLFEELLEAASKELGQPMAYALQATLQRRGLKTLARRVEKLTRVHHAVAHSDLAIVQYVREALVSTSSEHTVSGDAKSANSRDDPISRGASTAERSEDPPSGCKSLGACIDVESTTSDKSIEH